MKPFVPKDGLDRRVYQRARSLGWSDVMLCALARSLEPGERIGMIDPRKIQILPSEDEAPSIRQMWFFNHEVAITPLGVPLICGPGTITIVILMNQQAATIESKAILYAAMASIALITYIFLISSKAFLKMMGPYGNKVMFRIMGLILMVIAVEYFFSGVRPLLKG